MHIPSRLCLAAALTLTACSSSSSGTNPPPPDAGPTEGGNTDSGVGMEAAADVPAGQAQIHGQTVALGTMGMTPAKNPTVVAIASGAMVTAMGDSSGNWSMNVNTDWPFSLVYNAAGFAQLTDQEMMLSGDYNQGKTSLIDSNTAGLLVSALAGYDPSKGVLAISAVANGTTCPADDMATMTVNGATFVVSTMAGSDAGVGTTVYFRSGFPSSASTNTKAGEIPAAIAYNVPTGVNLIVTVQHPTCHQQPYPVNPAGTPVTYTGNVQTVPGTKTSYLRAFLQ